MAEYHPGLLRVEVLTSHKVPAAAAAASAATAAGGGDRWVPHIVVLMDRVVVMLVVPRRKYVNILRVHYHTRGNRT